MDKDFFSKQTRSSKIKSLIVSEYFPKYCKILLKKSQSEIRYIDLFAGPGIYDDGSLSTPILVGTACACNFDLSDVVKLIFNDYEHSEKLKENFEKHFPNKTFKKTPVFRNCTVGEDENINSFLSACNTDINGKNPYPSLLFIDPFGYKAVNTKILAEFLKNWGNEMFLFLNIKRIHAAVENKKFDELMYDLFPTTFNEIKNDRKYVLTVEDRLNLIIDNLSKEYDKIIGEKVFYTAFKFQEEDNAATSHYILHFTKHPRGYDLVKQIYNDFDNIGATLERNGTYSFDAKKLDNEKVAVLDFGDQNIYALSNQLKIAYKSKEISALKLFDEHQASTRFSRKHYVEALRKLVQDGDIFSKFTDEIDHKVTVLINKDCMLKFK